MAFTRLRRRPLDFVDERPEHDQFNFSNEDCDSSGEESFIRTTLKNPSNADEFWDSGFSSPPNYNRSCSMEEDGSPVKAMDVGQPSTPPFSPPAIGGLRLFDTPHTPRTLLQRSSCSGSPEAKAENRKISRFRRGSGARQVRTDPRATMQKSRLTANVNPFTPDLNNGLNNNKRTRKIR